MKMVTDLVQTQRDAIIHEMEELRRDCAECYTVEQLRERVQKHAQTLRKHLSDTWVDLERAKQIDGKLDDLLAICGCMGTYNAETLGICFKCGKPWKTAGGDLYCPECQISPCG